MLIVVFEGPDKGYGGYAKYGKIWRDISRYNQIWSDTVRISQHRSSGRRVRPRIRYYSTMSPPHAHMVHTRHGTWGWAWAGFGARRAARTRALTCPSPATTWAAPRPRTALHHGNSRRSLSAHGRLGLGERAEPWAAQPTRGRCRATAYRTDRPHAYPTIDQERGAF